MGKNIWLLSYFYWESLLFSVNILIFDRFDGKYVVFGKVIEGMDVVREVEKCGFNSGKLFKSVVIDKCGMLEWVWKRIVMLGILGIENRIVVCYRINFWLIKFVYVM